VNAINRHLAQLPCIRSALANDGSRVATPNATNDPVNNLDDISGHFHCAPPH
jgi:hypothetical protein